MAILSRPGRRDIYDPATRRLAVAVGLLFITATITFMVGDSLIQGAFSTQAGASDNGALAVGVLLIAGCGIAVAAIGVALLNLLSRFHKGLAYGYLAFRSLECAAIFAFGGYMLSTKNLVNYELAIYVFTGIGGLMLSYLLYMSKLVPPWLARLGMIGYAILLLAIPSSLMNVATPDSDLGMLFYVPGGIFELILPILLIARGFRCT